MRNILLYGFMLLIIASSCGTKSLTKYYSVHKPGLENVKSDFSSLTLNKRFSLRFTDGSYEKISLEMLTDSFKYVYEFGVSESRFADTLNKFGVDYRSVLSLLPKMKAERIFWITNLDYYNNYRKHSLVQVTVRPDIFTIPIRLRTYYMFGWFPLDQDFNEKNILLLKGTPVVMKINNAEFHKLTNRAVGAITKNFR